MFNAEQFVIEINRAWMPVLFWSAVVTGMWCGFLYWLLKSAIKNGVSEALTETKVRVSGAPAQASNAREAPAGFRWVLLTEEQARKVTQIHDMRAD